MNVSHLMFAAAVMMGATVVATGLLSMPFDEIAYVISDAEPQAAAQLAQ